MTEDEFRSLTEEILMAKTAEAVYRKLSPYINMVDALTLTARYVHDAWLAGELTKRNGMDQLDAVLRRMDR